MLEKLFKQEIPMPFLSSAPNSTSPVDIYYEDLGAGRPVVLVHAWPLDSSAWEKQTVALLAAGYRVITYDRRGFGRSARPADGYDLDTLAADLATMIRTLDLKDAVLVGHSMGGGEVARFLSRHNKGEVTAAIYIAAINPFLLKDSTNPDGADASVFAGLQKAIREDRFKLLKAFFRGYYNADETAQRNVSSETLDANFQIAVNASAIATHDCVYTWTTDLRPDHEVISLPTLVIHGTADASAPFALTASKTAMYPRTTLVSVADAPHGLIWTHAAEVNDAILRFVGHSGARELTADARA
jgi:non-heme chloroperoxidase